MITDSRPGQFFFSTMSHSLYDAFVYRLVTPFIWGCETRYVLQRYEQDLSSNHLEIGVGTGYLLDQCHVSTDELALSLMDLNERCLQKSTKRLSKYSPDIYVQDILKPLKVNKKRFSSIALNFVLHCVPGGFDLQSPKSKSIAFSHIYDALETGGVFFGATVLHRGVNRTLSSKVAMKALNHLTIFHNKQDQLSDFRDAIESYFDVVELEVVGSIVFWRAFKQ